MFVLGINAYHGDSSACLLRDGVLVAAAEEERFRRIKHWAGLPIEAVKYCLAEGGIDLRDLNHIAVNQDSKANLGKKVAFALLSRPDLGLVMNRIRNKRERAGVAEQLSAALGSPVRGTVHSVEHHLAHLASAFHAGPFETAAIVSVDGFGDFASAAWGVGSPSGIDIEDRVYFPHSLGIFYQAMTQYLGFPHYGDEYKVMGLAPYGRPELLPRMREIVQLRNDGSFRINLEYFRHHREPVEYEWENGEPTVGALYSPRLEELLGPRRQSGEELSQRHKDIARSVQAMYEEAFLNLLNRLYERHGIATLALAGGCAMNSVANGKVTRGTPFKQLYIQSAAGDAGGAIGAALQVWHETKGVARDARLKNGDGTHRSFVMDHAYWGPAFSNTQISALLTAKADDMNAAGCDVSCLNDEVALCRSTAHAITTGKIVGWFQGRMEWGPRALGNRSILGDPRRHDMKNILNLKIKRRESFRPFAPSILRERVSDWFEVDDDVPFMMQVYPIREEKRSLIPAVTHVDGSGRLQTVYRHTNPRYYSLIEAFQDLTGIPMVLNTSFNENEPVVCKPDEALDCFLRTKMDMLVLGNYVVSRRS